MTEIHTCSYSCQRIECIRAQRDELASRLAAAPPPAAARGEWVSMPREITQEMRDAGNRAIRMCDTEPGMRVADRAFYAFNAMLAVAPSPPAEGVQAGEVDGEALARRFHETYERLAPSFGYATRTETREFDPESANGRLMIAVCASLSQQPEARQITPEWVIGYFPANVAQEYRDAVNDAFSEFAVLHQKPEARGVVECNGHIWHDYGQINRSWCSKCNAVAVTGYEGSPYGTLTGERNG